MSNYTQPHVKRAGAPGEWDALKGDGLGLFVRDLPGYIVQAGLKRIDALLGDADVPAQVSVKNGFISRLSIVNEGSSDVYVVIDPVPSSTSPQTVTLGESYAAPRPFGISLAVLIVRVGESFDGAFMAQNLHFFADGEPGVIRLLAVASLGNQRQGFAAQPFSEENLAL